MVLEDVRELLADVGVVAVARQVDQHRDVAPVGVAADEHPDLAALAGVHRGLGHRRELVHRGVEQLVPRVGLEGVHQRLAGVAAQVEADPLEHRVGLLAQQRDPGQRLGVGGAGVEPEEPALADDLAVLERLHADVVEVRRAVHGRPGVRLGQHQQRLLAGLGLDDRGELAERRRHVLVGAQDAEAGARHGAQQLVVALLLEPVLAVAEEGEVVRGQPLEQLAALADLVLRERRRVGPQLADDLQHLRVHLVPVLDGLADVAQHPLDVLLDGGGVVALADAVDLDVHPGLADEAGLGLQRPVRHRRHPLQRSRDVALDVEERVDHDVHVAQLSGELHGQRVDEERHVVDDHLDDRVPARGPAVLAEGRGEDPHLRGALRPVVRELPVRGQGPVQVDVAAVAHVLGRDVAVVRRQQGRDLVVRRASRTLPGEGQVDGLPDEGGLVLIQRRH